MVRRFSLAYSVAVTFGLGWGGEDRRGHRNIFVGKRYHRKAVVVFRISSFSDGTFWWILQRYPLTCLWGRLTSSFLGLAATPSPFSVSRKPTGSFVFLSDEFDCCARGSSCWAERDTVHTYARGVVHGKYT